MDAPVFGSETMTAVQGWGWVEVAGSPPWIAARMHNKMKMASSVNSAFCLIQRGYDGSWR